MDTRIARWLLGLRCSRCATEKAMSRQAHVLVIVQVDAGLEEIPFCLDCATWLFRRRKKASILPFRGARRVETAAGRPGRRS